MAVIKENANMNLDRQAAMMSIMDPEAFANADIDKLIKDYEEELNKTKLPEDIINDSLSIIKNMEKLDSNTIEIDSNAENPPIDEFLKSRGFKIVETKTEGGGFRFTIEKE